MMPPYLVTCLSLLYDYVTWLTILTTEKKYLDATYNWKSNLTDSNVRN